MKSNAEPNADALAELAVRLSPLGERLKRGEPIGSHVTYQIGGPADLMVLADRADVAVEAISAARELGVPLLVLSRGSNVLVSDRGFRGLVVKLALADQLIDEETGEVYAEAGVRLSSLALATATLGLAGLEFAIGIPGAVGGAVVMNAGCHGNSISDTIVAARVLFPDGQVRRLAAPDLELGYRESRFQRNPDEIVLAAEFRLAHGDAAALLARAESLKQYRRDTQPIEPSCGSVFMRNPVAPPGKLIQQAGLKGTRIGGIMVSPKHANFLVNVGGGTATEVVALMRLVRDEVERVTGVRLEPEVRLVGDWRDGEGLSASPSP